MMIFGIIFVLFTIFTAGFQIALFFKMPWGEYAMGGNHKGMLPRPYRIAALVQSFLMVINGFAVINHIGLLHVLSHGLTRIWMIFLIVLMSLATLLNLITPSKKERMLWGPISALMLICVIIIVFF